MRDAELSLTSRIAGHVDSALQVAAARHLRALCAGATRWTAADRRPTRGAVRNTASKVDKVGDRERDQLRASSPGSRGSDCEHGSAVTGFPAPPCWPRAAAIPGDDAAPWSRCGARPRKAFRCHARSRLPGRLAALRRTGRHAGGCCRAPPGAADVALRAGAARIEYVNPALAALRGAPRAGDGVARRRCVVCRQRRANARCGRCSRRTSARSNADTRPGRTR